jgi:hypothetical protein
MSLDLIPVREHHEDYTAAHNHVGAFECCTAHASADDVLALLAEVEQLRRVIAEVESLTKDTDGNDVDGDAEIPIGEIRRALAEAAVR